MTDRIYSDAEMASIRRKCYEAGRAGEELYTVRGGEELVRCRECAHYCDLGCGIFGIWSPRSKGMADYRPSPDGYCSRGRRTQ